MYGTRVLVLLAMLVGFAHCFSWDIVVGGNNQLNFYSNGTLTHTEEITAATKIASITYDSVRYRLLFTDETPSRNVTISSYDLTTRKIQPLFTRKSVDSHSTSIVYDPVTQLLFMKNGNSIYSFSLNPVSADKADDGNLLVTNLQYVRDIAVDSCRGYIYWITEYNIEKARFDGSEREVIIDSTVYFRLTLAIDQQTQKIYWFDLVHENNVYVMYIESADFNGKNRKRFYLIESPASSLTVSKDYIYWNDANRETWQLPKNAAEPVARKLYLLHPSIYEYCWPCQNVAANYTLQEQIQATKSCTVIQDLIMNNSKPESTVSICDYYCLEGDCSVSGGQPTCSCKAGYTGKRCEVSACHKHCLNNGICSLNEEDEPVCECTAGYEGERCDVAITHADDCADNSTQQVLRDLRSGVWQVFQEEQKRILQLFSDNLNEDEAKNKSSVI